MQTLAVVDTRYKSMIMSCNADDDTDIKTIHSDYSFQTFLKKDMQLHKHCKRIILQRSCISENDDELSELLEQLQIIYTDIIIIIIYPGAKDKAGGFLRSVLKLEILNIVTAEDEQEQYIELERCLTYGMDALGWIRIFPELVQQDDINTEKKNIFAKLSGRKKIIIASCAVLIGCTAAVLVLPNSGSNEIAVQAQTSDTSAAEASYPEASAAETTSVTTYFTSSTSSAKTYSASSTSKSTAASVSSKSNTASKTTTSADIFSKTEKSSEISRSETSVSYTASAAPPTASRQPAVSAAVTTTSKRTTTTTQARIKVHGISLITGFANNNVILSVNKSVSISAVISPDNADNKSVIWSSNRPDIAVVDGGRITAKSKGKAIITAVTQDGGLSASCMVTVQ